MLEPIFLVGGGGSPAKTAASSCCVTKEPPRNASAGKALGTIMSCGGISRMCSESTQGGQTSPEMTSGGGRRRQWLLELLIAGTRDISCCISGRATKLSPSGRRRFSMANGPSRPWSKWAAACSSITRAARRVGPKGSDHASCVSSERLSRPTATTAFRRTWLGPHSSRTPHIKRSHSSLRKRMLAQPPQASFRRSACPCSSVGVYAPRTPVDSSTPVRRSNKAGVPHPGAAARSAASPPPART
mmetsp:Transcript_42703/g.99596  ORF Transcript_42703/g.99596 Transcript_42703/m.99596 type:complete len:244 (-) Transcript_42703:154-885(-)